MADIARRSGGASRRIPYEKLRASCRVMVTQVAYAVSTFIPATEPSPAATKVWRREALDIATRLRLGIAYELQQILAEL